MLLLSDVLQSVRGAVLSRLVRRSKRGDREAFQDLYGALYGPVWGFCRRRMARNEDVEDVVSQVFWKLLEKLDTLDPNQNVLAYSLAIARGILIDRARAAKAAFAAEGGAIEPSVPDPIGAAIEREQFEVVNSELIKLPPESRELLRLRFGDGLRYGQIAEILNLSEVSVRQRVSRLLRELRLRCRGRLGEELVHDL